MILNGNLYPKICVFIVTDGRLEYLTKTLESFEENIKYPFFQKFIISDSIDELFNDKVDELCQKYKFDFYYRFDRKSGFAETYKNAFDIVKKECDYCFILEDDFTFNEPIDISDLQLILENNNYLCQVALKRQAWNKEEIKYGGIVECDPDAFTDDSCRTWKYTNDFDYCTKVKWCEHRKFFTTNPSLVPMWVINKGWPVCEHSEGVFTHELFKDPEVKSAYLGHKFDPPKVHHIGEVRNGINY